MCSGLLIFAHVPQRTQRIACQHQVPLGLGNAVQLAPQIVPEILVVNVPNGVDALLEDQELEVVFQPRS